MLFLLSTALSASPKPLLGPSGPFYLGFEMSPNNAAESLDSQAMDLGFWVDPFSGQPYVEFNDSSQRERFWQEGWFVQKKSSVYNNDLTNKETTAPIALVEDAVDLGECNGCQYLWGDARLWASTSENGIRHRYLYDDEGRLIQVQLSSGRRYICDYDEAGRVSALEGPSGQKIWFRWTGSGGNVDSVVVSHSSGRAEKIRFRKEGEKLQAEVTNHLGRTTRSTYLGDELIGWTDPKGFSVDINWGDADSVHTIKDGAGRSWEFQTDLADRMIYSKDPTGFIERWEYEGEQWIAYKVYDDEIFRFGQNSNGEIVRMERKGGALSFSRNASGALTAVKDVSGSRIELNRDIKNRITQIVDPVGGTVSFSYDSFGLKSVQNRDGQRVKITRDVFGRPIKMEMGALELSLKRNQSGAVVELDLGGIYRIDRNSLGHITRIVGPTGQEQGFLRNGSGQIHTVRQGGYETHLHRDALEQLRKISKETLASDHKTVIRQEQILRRQISGEIVGLGDSELQRNALGWIEKIDFLNQSRHFRYDRFGNVVHYSYGKGTLVIKRDELNRPISYSEGEQVLELKRDSRGRIIQEGDLRIERGPRGWMRTAALGEKVWKWIRSAGGKLVKQLLPGGEQMGFDWDQQGRLSLIRYPSGGMIRIHHQPNEVIEEHLDVDGSRIFLYRYGFEAGTDWSWYDEGSGKNWVRRDQQGRIIAVDSGEQLVWAKGAPSLFDSKLGMVVIDENDQIVGAQTFADVELWDLPSGYLSYLWSDKSELSQIYVNEENSKLYYDARGRLSRICRSWRCWSFQYDPRGFLSGYTEPSKIEQNYLWAEGQLLMVEGRNVIDSPAGVLAWSIGEQVGELGVSLRGQMSWERTDRLSPIERGFFGYPYQKTRGPMFLKRGLIPLLGGPIVDKGLWKEPLSQDLLSNRQSLWRKLMSDLRFLENNKSIWGTPILILQKMQQIKRNRLGLRVDLQEDASDLQLPQHQHQNGLNHIPWKEKDPLGWIELYASRIMQGGFDPTAEELVEALMLQELKRDDPHFLTAIYFLEDVPWWLSSEKSHYLLAEIPQIE
ncbi:MAG: hypothetical protein CMK59_03175 [Proteobacteria bacterium]|nr:hypothetical protein [Pseudomonadota bacterium]